MLRVGFDSPQLCQGQLEGPEQDIQEETLLSFSKRWPDNEWCYDASIVELALLVATSSSGQDRFGNMGGTIVWGSSNL